MAHSIIKSYSYEVMKDTEINQARFDAIYEHMSNNKFNPAFYNIPKKEEDHADISAIVESFRNKPHETMFSRDASVLLFGRDAWVAASNIAEILIPYHYSVYSINATALNKSLSNDYSYTRNEWSLDNEIIDLCEWSDFLYVNSLDDFIDLEEAKLGKITSFLKGRHQSGLCTFLSASCSSLQFKSRIIEMDSPSAVSFRNFVNDAYTVIELADFFDHSVVKRKKVWK